VRRLLVPAVSGGLTSHPVSTVVNNVRNNGPQLTDLLVQDGPVSVSPSSLPRSGPSGAHPPDGKPAGSGETLF
jgi:hypothetical protein